MSKGRVLRLGDRRSRALVVVVRGKESSEGPRVVKGSRSVVGALNPPWYAQETSNVSSSSPGLTTSSKGLPEGRSVTVSVQSP